MKGTKESGKSKDPKELQMELPSLDILEAEVKRAQYKKNYKRVLRSTFLTLVVVAAIAVLIAVLLLPVIQISGTSMTDTLQDGDIVVAVKGSKFKTGEVVAFYYNNNILVKRVIASPGQWVDIDDEGNVYVDNELLDEPYISEKAKGDCNIDLPYQVPEGKFFLMGDHRSTSIDSRNKSIGCIESGNIIGKIQICIWPFKDFGLVR